MLVEVRPSNEAHPILYPVILRERPRLPFTARIERAHSYRARSASKKGTWLLPAGLGVIFSILLMCITPLLASYLPP
jgi:cytochrome c biogenesis protein CcdA